MAITKTRPPMILGVHRIAPVDLDHPSVQSALEQARRSLSDPRLRDILEIRTAIQGFICNALAAEGYVHPPVYMTAGCTDPLNHWTYPARTHYYGQEISLTQSLILQKILMVMLSTADRVFWASPNIRMELRITRKEYKYASEFMQVDFERRDGTYQEMLAFVGKLTAGLYRHLNAHHAGALERVRGAPLPELPDPLPLFDAQEVRRCRGLPDDDAVERWAAREAGEVPFLLVNLRREAYDCLDPATGRFLNYDLVLPPSVANPHPVECLSGAERTRSLGDLRDRMDELGYPMEYFAPFFALFETLDHSGGTIRCAGGGFGVERLTYGLLGLRDIHEVYPFPRMAEGVVAI